LLKNIDAEARLADQRVGAIARSHCIKCRASVSV
jgi:hypothetical protein